MTYLKRLLCVLALAATLVLAFGSAPPIARASSTVDIHPVKVMFNPFHHGGVYGIFELPTGTVPGRVAFGYGPCTAEGSVCNSGLEFDGVQAGPGHYLVKGCIAVSDAMWLYMDLEMAYGTPWLIREPEHWTLSYAGVDG